VLAGDGRGKKMRIDLANAVDLRGDFDALETGAPKCAAPVVRGQEARIGANFGIRAHIAKAVQDLKDHLGVDWLIHIRPHAFADHQASIMSQRAARLVQAK